MFDAKYAHKYNTTEFVYKVFSKNHGIVFPNTAVMLLIPTTGKKRKTKT
jgi:hypothetical protein